MFGIEYVPNALVLCVFSPKRKQKKRNKKKEHQLALDRCLGCIAVCCSVLQCAAVCYSVFQCVALNYFEERGCCCIKEQQRTWNRCAVCCSALQCATVCCSVLQCAAVCCYFEEYAIVYFCSKEQQLV